MKPPSEKPESIELPAEWRSNLNDRLAHTIDETVALSGLGRTTIFAAIKRGELQARKYDRRTTVLDEDLRSFLRSLPVVRPAA